MDDSNFCSASALIKSAFLVTGQSILTLSIKGVDPKLRSSATTSSST